MYSRSKRSRPDADIQADLVRLLAPAPGGGSGASPLKVDVRAGHVRLAGNVATNGQHRRLLRQAARIPGVQVVEDGVSDDEHLASAVQSAISLSQPAGKPRACVVLGTVYLDWPFVTAMEYE